MGSLSDNGGIWPGDGGSADGLPGLPEEWGVIVVPDDLSELSAEVTAVQAELRRNLVAGDVEGEGADEWLAGLPDGRVVAVRERGGSGGVLWEFRCDRPVRDLIFADVDGDGKGELVVETEGGCVRIAR